MLSADAARLTDASQGKLFRGQKGGRKSSSAPEGLGYVDMGESYLMAINLVSGGAAPSRLNVDILRAAIPTGLLSNGHLTLRNHPTILHSPSTARCFCASGSTRRRPGSLRLYSESQRTLKRPDAQLWRQHLTAYRTIVGIDTRSVGLDHLSRR